MAKGLLCYCEKNLQHYEVNMFSVGMRWQNVRLQTIQENIAGAKSHFLSRNFNIAPLSPRGSDAYVLFFSVYYAPTSVGRDII